MDVARLLDSLRRAVAREPGDDVLRAHLAEMLVAEGLGNEAVGHLGQLLAEDPGNIDYQDLMREAMGGPAPERGGGGDGSTAPPTHPASRGPRPTDPGFDWGAAEQDLTGGLAHEPVETSLRLSDVGGLADVKAHIEAAFLTPLRNPRAPGAVRGHPARWPAAVRPAGVRQDLLGPRGRR